MRTLTSMIVAMVVGVSAPAAAQSNANVESELDAELERAGEPAADQRGSVELEALDETDEPPKKKKKKATRTERVVETTTEFETDALVLPSADELLSGSAKIDDDDDDTPRAPRAVLRQEVVERRVEVDEEPLLPVTGDDEAVAGDAEVRLPSAWKTPASQGPGDHAGAARVVPPTVAVQADEDTGSTPIEEPVTADRMLAADPDIGQPIEPEALSGMVDTELRNIANRRVEYIGSLRSSLDEGMQAFSTGAQSPDVEGRRVEIARLQQQLAQMNTEAQNIGVALEKLGPGATPAELSDLRDRVLRAQDRLEAMADADSNDVFRSALSEFRSAVGDIERSRVALERQRF